MSQARPRDLFGAGPRSWAIWGVFGAACAIKLSLAGEIYVGEVFALVALPLLMHAQAIRAPVMLILLGGLVFSTAQLVSDLYNNTSVESSIKGIGAPLVFCVTIAVLFALFERDLRRVFPVLGGIVLTELIQVVFWPNEYQQFKAWKFGYGPAVLTAVLLVFSTRRFVPLSFVVGGMLLFAAISVLNDSRSLAGLPLIGLASYVVWRGTRFSSFKKWLLRGQAPVKLVWVIVPLVVVANVALGLLFSSNAMQPLLDADAAAKYRQQANSDVGMLLAGRSEWLVSIRAFLDAPLLGHGSWPEDTHGYLEEYAALRQRYGISDDLILDARSVLIPAHSYLFGAMVWAGVVGGIFWLFFSYRLIASYVSAAPWLPVYFHVGIVLFLWDVLFSPFGASSRWATAVFAAALLAASRAKSRVSSS